VVSRDSHGLAIFIELADARAEDEDAGKADESTDGVYD
jgi:hypothetical protein